MTFAEAIKSGFSNYVTFSGRANRPAYWYWVLFSILASIVCLIIDGVLGYGPGGMTPITSVFDLVTFLPSIAVGARRLHDTDRSGWWLLLALTGIGTIVLIIWFCFRGTEGPNRYGPA